MDLSLASLSSTACVGVVLATTDNPRSSTPLHGLNPDVGLGKGCQAFWGATKLAGGTVEASGGRVLTVTATGEGVEDARTRAYEAVRALAGRLGAAGLTFRTDIARAVPGGV